MNVLRKIKSLVTNKKTFVFLLAIVLIVLPLKHIVNSISLIVFFLIAYSNVIITKQKLNYSKLSIAFVLVYVLVIFSLIWTIDFENTLKGIQKMAPFLALPLGFAFMPKLEQKDIKKILSYFSIAIVFYALYCIIVAIYNSIETNNTSFLFYHNLSSSLNEMSAIYLSVMVSFTLFYLIFETSQKNLFNYMSILILTIFLLLLSSKTIILFSIIVLLFYFFKLDKKKLFLGGIAFAIFSIFFLYSKNPDHIKQRIFNEIEKTNIEEVLTKEEIGQNYYWTGLGLRLFQAKSYFEMASEDNIFLLGYGFNASQKKLIEKYKKYDLYPGFYSYNFHNQYVQILAELGLLGLALLLLIFYLEIKNAIRDKNLLFFVFTLLILFLCMSEVYLWRQRGMVFFITISLLLFNSKKALQD